MAMNRRGFTLISVMIAVVILAVGVLALSRTLTGAMQANTKAGLRTIALDIARQRMEFLRSQPPGQHGRLRRGLAAPTSMRKDAR